MDSWIESTHIDSQSNLLSSKYIDSDHTKLSRDTLLSRPAKRIEPLADGNIAKTDSPQSIDKFSLRESTGDSASPEVDVPPYGLGKLATHNDVTIKESSARF
jgi:hypothetical protein